MSQLGFTFYPKDWWTSDSFFLLQPFERYIYLECLFMMYSNNGWIANNKLIVERRLGATIKDEVWSKILGLFICENEQLTHKSVNSRLKKTIANRENGQKGGAPVGNQNARKTTQTTQENNPKQPVLEKEIEREIEIENKIDNTPPSGGAPKSFKKFSKDDFYLEVKKHSKKFSPETCKQFFDYWTELSASGKMKFQLEKTWETERRIQTWKRNEDKFGAPKPKQNNNHSGYLPGPWN